VSPRVFGSLLWEHLTAQPYLTPKSDLDLLWSVADSRSAAGLVEGLQRLDADSPFRLDGELELSDGGGVNWRELSQAGGAGRDAVLVKTMNGAELRTVAELFDAAACAS
jgi:phosphoribosyl-dephospho-CoA transferase